MIRRIFEIITWPFYLTFQIISFPFFLLKLIIVDKIEKHKGPKRSRKKLTSHEIVETGKYLFPNFNSDFEIFINSFLQDKKKFISENKALLISYDNFEMIKLKAIDVIYIFGDSKELLNLTDWRGEENEREIESFLEDKLQIKSDWKNTNKLRKGAEEEQQNDGEFIIDLFKSIDKDLKPLNKRLVFFDLGWDAYVYTITDLNSYKIITDRFGILFHGTENLIK